jgi:hypothetical protein
MVEVKMREVEKVRMLLKAGADPNLRDIYD